MRTIPLILPSDGGCIQIEVEPLSRLVIHLIDASSLPALQRYSRAYGVVWMEVSQGQHCLLMPWGTVQQHMEEYESECEELSLIHLPGGGALEHRRVLPPGIDPGHPQAEAWKVSMVSLFHPVC